MKYVDGFDYWGTDWSSYRKIIIDEIVAFLKKNNLKFIEKRNKQGGCLWVVGGKELEKTLELLETKGIKFSFTVGGGKATDYNPGWFYEK